MQIKKKYKFLKFNYICNFHQMMEVVGFFCQIVFCNTWKQLVCKSCIWLCDFMFCNTCILFFELFMCKVLGLGFFIIK
jgi:hypothetical protein